MKKMGLGTIGDITFKHPRYRWVFEAKDKNGKTFFESWVKLKMRPNLEIEEIQNEKGEWIPGKSKWEDLTITFECPPVKPVMYEQDEEWELELLPVKLKNFTEGLLKLTSGNNELERWVLERCSPVMYNEADHYNAPNVIEFTFRMKEVKYENLSKGLENPTL